MVAVRQTIWKLLAIIAVMAAAEIALFCRLAQAMIYAFNISDHSMGAQFKMFDDRQFCNGHRTVTVGMPVGYLISGNYSQETNLQMILEGRAQVGGNILVGMATDEFTPDKAIDDMANTLVYALEHPASRPSNFLGILFAVVL